MDRQPFAATARASALVPRPPAHLARRRTFRPTPEAPAGLIVLALASTPLFGFPGALAFFAAAGAVFAIRPLFNAGDLLRFSPLLALPVLAVLSTLWSDAPERSMRMGLELLSTFVAAILACRNLRPERLLLLLFGAFLFLVLLTAPAVPHALASGTPLVAWAGSKNVIGFCAHVLVASSLAVAVDGRQPAAARVAALAAVPLGGAAAWLSQSGGAAASVALTLLVFPPLAWLAALRPSARAAMGGLALCALAAAAFLADDVAAMAGDLRRDALGKDATLTGRTHLWEVADGLSAARPVWGYGYAAFWRHGNIDAEGLWRWGGIANRSGFNFHNAFVGVRIDLGLVGAVVLVATCAGVAVVATVRQFLAPSVPMACLLGMTVVAYFRSVVEEGLVAPFSVATLIWLATALYAFPPRRGGCALTAVDRGRRRAAFAGTRDGSRGRP